MGNNQSNQNWKVFRITNKTSHSGYITLHLDDYVTYNNGNRKFIDLDANPLTWIRNLDVYKGSYIEINIAKTSCESSGHNFSPFVVRHADGQIVERTDSNGNIVRDLIEGIASVGETIEARQRHVALIEQSRHATNHAWTKQTSWDMPPGWK